MSEGNAWNWQHTRCRIGKVDVRDSGNVVQLTQVGDHAFSMLASIHHHICSGTLAGLAVAAVMTDRSTVTAYDTGSSSAADMVGVTEMLKHRLMIRMD